MPSSFVRELASYTVMIVAAVNCSSKDSRGPEIRTSRAS